MAAPEMASQRRCAKTALRPTLIQKALGGHGKQVRGALQCQKVCSEEEQQLSMLQ